MCLELEILLELIYVNLDNIVKQVFRKIAQKVLNVIIKVWFSQFSVSLDSIKMKQGKHIASCVRLVHFAWMKDYQCHSDVDQVMFANSREAHILLNYAQLVHSAQLA